MRGLLRIILLLFFHIAAFSQGVCDLTSNVEKGDFDMPAAVCIGENLPVTDKSGGTNIRYVFGYSGQSASQLTSVPSSNGPNADWAFITDGNYVVLQYGKKNGRDMYQCKVVNVRKNSEPVFSYFDCSNNQLEIVIPKDPRNNFDFYTIDWGDASAVEKVYANNLPFKKIKTNYFLPKTIKVDGGFNTSSTCLASDSKTIPFRDPAVFPNGYDSPTRANISQLVLEKADEAVLTIDGSYDNNGYDLFMKEQGKPYSLYKKNVNPGKLTVSLPDSNKSYCFYLLRNNNNCREFSAEICTVLLEEVNPTSSLTQEIIWSQYPNELSNIPNNNRNYGRYVDSFPKLLKKEDGTPLPEIPVSGSSYTDNVNCKKKYCYRVETTTIGQVYYFKFKGVSTSKELCFSREDFHPPAITKALVTVNESDASEIIFTDNSPWTLKREKYILFRDNGTEFKEINGNISTSPTTDADVDNSQKSNCYKIAFLDECGSTSELSPAFCTVFLSEGNKNELLWSVPSPFANTGISRYEVQSYDENTNIPSSETTLPATQPNYYPDLSKFEEEAKFRVKITGNDGTESYSNIYTIPLAVKLLLPDAFTPNNDAINDKLEVKGTFKRIAEFELQIYNRWGSSIFSSKDPLKTWDGSFQGMIVPADTYTYKLYAKLIDGTEINKAGVVILIR